MTVGYSGGWCCCCGIYVAIIVTCVCVCAHASSRSHWSDALLPTLHTVCISMTVCWTLTDTRVYGLLQIIYCTSQQGGHTHQSKKGISLNSILHIHTQTPALVYPDAFGALLVIDTQREHRHTHTGFRGILFLGIYLAAATFAHCCRGIVIIVLFGCCCLG